ncbi:homing endonuclease associated repeat-containing protein [Halorussus litoreus]|uniref:homing endonuclease associated repeat-containing protein n=1 Tax=Halorussus litoreus TaxID=1710536 RepID=UPI000E242AE0|nr:hypothetical protein [Halorussus litoreus]
MSQPAKSSATDHGPPDRDTLLTHLQSLAAVLGKTPTVVDIHKDDTTPFAPTEYLDTFGDWDTALREAGLDPTATTTKIPDHELLAELQRLYTELGSPPSRTDMVERGRFSDTVYRNRFGSWNEALQQAMLDTNELDDSDLLRELERVAHELDCIPTADEMREYGKHRPVTYHRRFGSWQRALDVADFSTEE